AGAMYYTSPGGRHNRPVVVPPLACQQRGHPGPGVRFMKIEFVAAAGDAAAVVLFAFDDRKLSPGAAERDAAAGGAIGRAMARSRFTGAKGQSLGVGELDGAAVTAVGLGAGDKLDDLGVETGAAAGYN